MYAFYKLVYETFTHSSGRGRSPCNKLLLHVQVGGSMTPLALVDPRNDQAVNLAGRYGPSPLSILNLERAA